MEHGICLKIRKQISIDLAYLILSVVLRVFPSNEVNFTNKSKDSELECSLRVVTVETNLIKTRFGIIYVS